MRNLSIAFLFVFLFSVSFVWAQKDGDLKIEPYVFENAKKEKTDAEFGRVTVPENRRNKSSRMIEIAFVRFKSTNPNPGPPIVYLAGGPGGSGIASAQFERFPLFMAMRQFGDVIALDQRGTGSSKPSLSCKETVDQPLNRAGLPDQMIRGALDRARSCAEYWRGQGVDLDGYNTAENADDIESLRKALGVSKISLWGISYGTHLGLAFIKRHESSVDRSILAGVNGLDDRRKLPGDVQSVLVELAKYAAADPAIKNIVPDLLGLMKSVFDELEKHPASAEITDPQTKEKVTVVFGKTDVQFLVAQGLGDARTIRSLPLAFYAMSKGDYKAMAGNVLSFRKGRIPSAMFGTMDCASDGSKERYARIKKEEPGTILGNAINLMIADSCPAWKVTDLGDAFRSPVKSQVPVLMISGTLDGRTPPVRAEDARKGFPNSTHLIIEGASHDNDLFLSTPKIADTMFAFMRGEKLPADIKTVTTPAFEFRKP